MIVVEPPNRQLPAMAPGFFVAKIELPLPTTATCWASRSIGSEAIRNRDELIHTFLRDQ
jgi:hypothetical protein